jgi:hypothetical protein
MTFNRDRESIVAWARQNVSALIVGVLGSLAASGILEVFKAFPQLTPYLTYRFCIPVWLVISLLVGVCILVDLSRRARAARGISHDGTGQRSSHQLKHSPTDEGHTKPPKPLQSLSHGFGLRNVTAAVLIIAIQLFPGIATWFNFPLIGDSVIRGWYVMLIPSCSFFLMLMSFNRLSRFDDQSSRITLRAASAVVVVCLIGFIVIKSTLLVDYRHTDKTSIQQREESRIGGRVREQTCVVVAQGQCDLVSSSDQVDPWEILAFGLYALGSMALSLAVATVGLRTHLGEHLDPDTWSQSD